MRRFFIPADQISSKESVLTGPDAHHLYTVLRLKAGERVIVFDGTGNQYQARILVADRNRVKVAIEKSIPEPSESGLELTLAQGYLKDKKMDFLVRHLTELGVTRLVPFFAQRSVPTPDTNRLQARYKRWQKISLESMKQCGRSRPMAIAPAVAFNAVLEMARPHDLRLVFWEQVEKLPSLEKTSGPKPAKPFIMVGPEGGFDADEIALAIDSGFKAVSMGPRILRAETAALAACTLVQYRFGDMGENLLDKPGGV